MKKIILVLLFTPFISFAQWDQIGADIDGDEEGDSFGFATSFNASGTTIVAGAWQNQTNGEFSGHTKILDWDGTSWIQRGQNINGIGPNEWSGYEVAISADGNTIATTSLVATNSIGITSTGYVRIFDWDGTNWVQRGENIEGDGEQPIPFAQFFGYSIDLSSDGNVIVIGAPNVDGPTATDFGLVRIFDWNGTAWIKRGNDIDGLTENDALGFAVSISADGNTVAAGAPGNDDFSSNTNGSARVFQWDGTAWNQRGTDINGLASGDSFGKSIAISADGNTIAAGAPDSVAGTNTTCTARVFDWNGTSWTQRGDTFIGEEQGNSLGADVALNEDGTVFAVSAPAFLSNGKTYIYKWDGNTWSQQGETIIGEAQSDIAGNSINLNDEGSSILIGAYGNDGNGSGSGHARVFQNLLLNITTINQKQISFYPNPTENTINFYASEEIISITLFSVLGKKIASFSGNDIELIIDLSNQASGSYFAKIVLETNTQVVKIIKN